MSVKTLPVFFRMRWARSRPRSITWSTTSPTSAAPFMSRRTIRQRRDAEDALRESEAMRSMLGENFVELYCTVKEHEYKEFQEIITPWEREILMFNV